MSAENGQRPARARWPEAIRLEAIRLRRERGLRSAEIAGRLEREHGAAVGESTVAGWLSRASRDETPSAADLAGEIGAQAALLLRITGSEIRRLDRKQGPKDVERIERLARSLKVLEGLKAAAPNTGESKAPKAKTLEDLTSEAEEERLS